MKADARRRGGQEQSRGGSPTPRRRCGGWPRWSPGEPPEAMFGAATREALQYFGGSIARMIRYEPDGTATLVAREGTTYPERVGGPFEGYPPTGLTGLKDRIEALGGTFSVHSPAGGGTTVSCELPVLADG
jgi:hypothetical protein